MLFLDISPSMSPIYSITFLAIFFNSASLLPTELTRVAAAEAYGRYD